MRIAPKYLIGAAALTALGAGVAQAAPRGRARGGRGGVVGRGHSAVGLERDGGGGGDAIILDACGLLLQQVVGFELLLAAARGGGDVDGRAAVRRGGGLLRRVWVDHLAF